MQNKADLRKLALAKRNALSEDERRRKSRVICWKVASVILSAVFLSNTKKNEVEGPHEMGDASQKSNKHNETDLVAGSFTQTNRYPSNEVLRLHSNTPCSHSAQDDVCVVALYDPINSEVDLSPLTNLLQKQGAKVVKPLMSDTKGNMEFVNWQEEFDPQKVATTFDSAIHPEEIDIIVCPVVAFDSEGNRLGYGGGYYDRYLPRLSPLTLKIGVAFACQQVKQIPTDPHDIPLDYVFTE